MLDTVDSGRPEGRSTRIAEEMIRPNVDVTALIEVRFQEHRAKCNL